MCANTFNQYHIKNLSATLPDREKSKDFRKLLITYGGCIFKLGLLNKKDKGFLQAMNSKEEAAFKVGKFMASLDSQDFFKITIKTDEIQQKSRSSYQSAKALGDSLAAAIKKVQLTG